MPNVAVRRKRQIYPTKPTLSNLGIELTEADVERILRSFGRRRRSERRTTQKPVHVLSQEVGSCD